MFDNLLGFSPTSKMDDPFGGLLGGVTSFSQIDPISAISSATNAILPGVGSLIGGIANVVGLGAEDWSSVEARTKKEIQTIINHGINKYLGSNSTAEDFTKYDQYIATDAQYRIDVTKRQSAPNSINRGKLMYQLLHQHLKAFREEMSKKFVLTKKRIDPTSLSIKSYKGATFNMPYLGSITYAHYEPKRSTVKPVNVTANPVDTNVKPTSTGSAGSSPTVSDSANEENNALKHFGWIGLALTAVIGGVIALAVYLIKKIKK